MVGEAGPEAIIPLNKIKKFAEGAGSEDLIEKLVPNAGTLTKGLEERFLPAIKWFQTLPDKFRGDIREKFSTCSIPRWK